MTDAPERTLSEDHVTPVTLAEADERLRDAEGRIATLEQQLADAITLATHADEERVRLRNTVVDLRAAIREWVKKRRYHAGYVVYDDDLDELLSALADKGEPCPHCGRYMVSATVPCKACGKFADTEGE